MRIGTADPRTWTWLVRSTTWVLLAVALPAQALAPDVHWGANAFPPVDPEVRLSLSLNRFTEFSKSGQRYNDYDETFGFNMLHLSVADQIPAWPDFTFTLFAGGGPTNDQPTRWLQNDFLHKLWGQDAVPVDGARSDWDYACGGSLTYSRERELWDQRLRLFGGAGASFGSLYQEFSSHVGAEFHVPSLNAKVGLLERFAWLDSGETLHEVADDSNIVQLYVGYVPSRLDTRNWFADWLGNPEVGFTLTYDTGLFLESGGGDAIGTWFISMRVKWPTGLMFEIWNDIANGTDFGPTMGMTFSVDLLSVFEQRWF
ncbi:MAG TPA: hypothetical protein VF384_06425 [Planctomycetota bacterium]